MSRFLGSARGLGLRLCFQTSASSRRTPLKPVGISPYLRPLVLFEASSQSRHIFASKYAATSKFRDIASNGLEKGEGGETDDDYFERQTGLDWDEADRNDGGGGYSRGGGQGYDREPRSYRGGGGYSDFEEGPRRERHYDDREDFGSGLKERDWSNVELEEGVIDNYEPLPSSMTPEEARAFREEHRITLLTNEESVPVPFRSFDETGFPAHILDALRGSGFELPMPVQAQGWPVALTGRDLIAIGQTGSGKTLGYLLPALVHIEKKKKKMRRRGDGPSALVLAPTRELAQQIESVLRPFGRNCDVRSISLFGGASKGHQIRGLRDGVDVVIATPGRLIDLLEMRVLNLERCTYVVLDEADRMLDMGFEPQIQRVMGQVRPDRQMLMWSATWPEDVRELATNLLSKADGERIKKHVHLNIGSVDLQANANIKQNVSFLERHEKQSKLVELVRRIAGGGDAAAEARILIFVETKRGVDYIENVLRRERFGAAGIHGDKSQQQRDRVLRDFRRGNVPILVATDVASRGLDVDDIQHVINYDSPNSVEDYVHRIGRTGRRDRSGTSHIFLTHGDASIAGGLAKVMRQAGQEVPAELEELMELGHGGGNRYRRYGGGGGGRGGRDYSSRYEGQRYGGGGGSYNRGGFRGRYDD